MNRSVLDIPFAIVGGGKFCRIFLEFVLDTDFGGRSPSILGVADENEQAEGFRFARSRGIFTTRDYRDFYGFPSLAMIVELTKDPVLAEIIKEEAPEGVEVVNHFEVRSLWDEVQVEAVRAEAFKKLRSAKEAPEAIPELLRSTADGLTDILRRRNKRALEIELELFEKERTLHQIIQGSTIPTFVVDKAHTVTHWNKAAENLTGISAEDIVGTNKQWIPFYDNPRPSLADVIVDQIDEEEIVKYYEARWRRSELIEGAYEAEGFFPRLGESGKWCWFTAAPIKAPDGTVIGAIETLWDRTEEKKAQEERERHNKELSTLCSIYSALNTSTEMEEGLRNAVLEVRNFLDADGVCIYLLGSDGRYHLHYCSGVSENACAKLPVLGEASLLYRVAQKGEFTVYEDLQSGCSDEICPMEEKKLLSLAYIPISSRENETLGVMRMGSLKAGCFSNDRKNLLELIGNRIGVAVENALLQEQYIQSEEKYRTLFNNDPNPTFILDSTTLEILDVNERVEDCYGYSREELYRMPFLELGDDGDEEIEAGLRAVSGEQSALFSKKRHFAKGGRSFFVNICISGARYGEKDVLIVSTTDITESVEREAQLIQASKMTTLGMMAAGMAHEINQPLNVIQVCADFFLKTLNKGRSVSDEDVRNMAREIVANVGRATGVIKHVRDFARQSEVTRSKVSLNDPIRETFKILGHQLKVHQIQLELDLADDLPFVMAEHNRLEQVFVNLVTNAIDAMDERGEKEGSDFTKRLTIRSYVEGEQVAAEVSDNGTGMREDVVSKIFEPFFTTKEVGKGTGLGVSISYGIVKDYDGSIEVDTEPGRGTVFKIKFPGA